VADLSEGAVGTRTTTAYFRTRGAADAVVTDLVARGIPREEIRMVGAGAGATATSKDCGFWDELKDFCLPSEERHAYAEGLRRGGSVISVRAEAMDYETVLDVLDRDDAVDLDKQEAIWRTEGWSGYSGPKAAAISSASASRPETAISSDPERARASRGESAALAEATLVSDEELGVGKRDVSHNRVRIRSYVIEIPRR
jgi:hypothetical protein